MKVRAPIMFEQEHEGVWAVHTYCGRAYEMAGVMCAYVDEFFGRGFVTIFQWFGDKRTWRVSEKKAGA